MEHTFKGWSPTAVYLCDNGRSLCGEHLGATAKVSGRDRSGQRVERVTAASVAAAGMTLSAITCERCGRSVPRD